MCWLRTNIMYSCVYTVKNKWSMWIHAYALNMCGNKRMCWLRYFAVKVCNRLSHAAGVQEWQFSFMRKSRRVNTGEAWYVVNVAVTFSYEAFVCNAYYIPCINHSYKHLWISAILYNNNHNYNLYWVIVCLYWIDRQSNIFRMHYKKIDNPK